jgi:hypothetical protein
MKTKSESLFEGFLATNNLPFEKVEEDTTPRPDYRVSVGGCVIIFELKQLTEDENFGVIKDPAYPHIKSSSRTMGDHIRRKIASSKKQIQFGTNQGIPSILLIYNDIDPVFQDFGHRAYGFHRRYVWRVHDSHKQRKQHCIGLVQRKKSNASREQEHVVQRSRPFV